ATGSGPRTSPSSSAVEHISAGALDDRPQPAAAEFFWPRLLFATAVAEPRQQVGPPATLLGLGGLQPVRRVGGGAVVDLIAGLGAARRGHQRRGIAPGGKE